MRTKLAALIVSLLPLLVIAAAVALPPLLSGAPQQEQFPTDASLPAVNVKSSPCTTCGEDPKDSDKKDKRPVFTCAKSLMFSQPGQYYSYYCLQYLDECSGTGTPVHLTSQTSIAVPQNCPDGCATRFLKAPAEESDTHQIKGVPRQNPEHTNLPSHTAPLPGASETGCVVLLGPVIKFKVKGDDEARVRFAKLFLVGVDPNRIEPPEHRVPHALPGFFGVGQEVAKPPDEFPVIDLTSEKKVKVKNNENKDTGLIRVTFKGGEITYQITILHGG